MTGRRRLLNAATALFWMWAPTAYAQSNPLTPTTGNPTTDATRGQPETVVVTGRKADDEIETVISQFIDVHAAKNRKTGQYMRDSAGPICPVTAGLPSAFNAFVTARVLAVAKSVGAPTGISGKCDTNVEILFTDEPRQLVTTLAERTHGAILGMHFVHERRTLLEMTHSIQAWYVTGTRYERGDIEPVATVNNDETVVPSNDRKLAIDNAYRNAPDQIALGSNIPARRLSSIVNVLIVADASTLAGHEIGPVSDYIAMLALSQAQSLDECNELPSILDLMSSGCSGREKPTALTASDIAYLKGLYAADLGATAVSVQKDSIASGMKTNIGDH